SEKMVHRDISPDNLILTTSTDGRPCVKLIDLGISKSLEAGNTMTATGQFLGKVHYASPEQFGGDLDGRSDLYSLGVVLYKLLTNADPFVADNYREIISAHLFQPPRPFDVVAPDAHIPAAVERVIFRALEKDPDNRYANAAEFCAAVEEAFDVAPDARLTRPARTSSDAIARAEAATVVPASSDKTEVSMHAAPTAIEPPIGGTPTVLDRDQGSSRLRPWLFAAAVALVLAIGVAIAMQRMEAARIAALGRFHAVVIGESNYRKYESLPTAVNDARAVARSLETL